MEHDHHDHEGCDSCDEGDMPEVQDEVGKEIDITTDGGIKKKILRVGSGWAKPPKDSDVTVHYVGTLTDGTGFDSSRERGEPFQFKLGVGQVIKGWDQGVASMKKGELAMLTCTAPYAYGDAGSPPKIPGGATLNFEVELLNWTDEKDVSVEKDGSLMKKTLKEGEGWEQPGEDATVTVSFVARVKDTGAEIERSDSLTFGVGEEQAPAAALDRAVQQMKKGEHALITAAPRHAYGDAGCPAKGVPAGTAVVFDVTLISLVKPRMVYEMTGAELLEGAEAKRLEGNALYKEGKLVRAMRRYKKALEFLEADYKFSEDEKKKAKPAKVPCYLNVAACKVATREWKDVIQQCDKALEIESGSVRALVRRGKAQVALDEWDVAERDFAKALEVDPANADALRESKLLAGKRAEADKKIKSRLQGMFGRMAKLEEEDAKREQAERELLEKQLKEEEEARKKKAEAEAAEKKSKAEAEEKSSKAEEIGTETAGTGAAVPAAPAADVEMPPSQ